MKRLFSFLLVCISLSFNLFSDSAQDWIKRGYEASRKDKVSEALSCYTRALELEPKNAMARYLRAHMFFIKWQFQNAVDDYSLAIKNGPKEKFILDAYYFRGSAFEAQGKYDGALNEYNKFLELNPNSEKGYTARGNLYFIKERFEDAITDYNRARAIDTKRTGPYFGTALSLSNLKRTEEALTYMEAALKLSPDANLFHIWKHIISRKGGKKEDDEFKIFSAGLKGKTLLDYVVFLFSGDISPEQLLKYPAPLHPRKKKIQNCKIHHYLGQYYLLEGNIEKAAENFRKSVEAGLYHYLEHICSVQELKKINQK
jgi:tetratricopeptide (TPR) repeat protein